jgi:hypothetical protein
MIDGKLQMLALALVRHTVELSPADSAEAVEGQAVPVLEAEAIGVPGGVEAKEEVQVCFAN